MRGPFGIALLQGPRRCPKNINTSATAVASWKESEKLGSLRDPSRPRPRPRAKTLLFFCWTLASNENRTPVCFGLTFYVGVFLVLDSSKLRNW